MRSEWKVPVVFQIWAICHEAIRKNIPTMTVVCLLAMFSAVFPLWLAWKANSRTTLFQAMHWAVAAWIAWSGALLLAALRPDEDHDALRYLALSLTACAGMAVFGARRPGVGAWNFVLLVLLAVLLFPLLRGLQTLADSPLQLLFLSAVIAVGLLNYLPTSLSPGVMLVAGACVLEIPRLTLAVEDSEHWRWGMILSSLMLAGAPWLAYLQVRWRVPSPALFDRIWLDFRDRFGLIWSQRVREQFNRAAANAGWQIILRWQGLRLLRGSSLPDDATQTQIVNTLVALLKRFEPEENPG